MMHRPYSDEVFKAEAPVFVRNYVANRVYKKVCIGVLVVVRGYLEVTDNQDRITELNSIADTLISRINTHARNLKSLAIVLSDLSNESEKSNDPDVLKLRGEIRRLLSQPM